MFNPSTKKTIKTVVQNVDGNVKESRLVGMTRVGIW
jgi:hypothetical protein